MFTLEQKELEALKTLLEAPDSDALENSAKYIKEVEHYVNNYDFGRNHAVLCHALSGLGAAYGREGNLSRAAEYFEKVLQVATAHRITETVNMTLINLSTIEARRGNYYYAIETWQKLLKRKISLRNRLCVQGNLIIAYNITGQYSKALQNGFMLIERLEKENFPAEYISALTNQGSIYHRLREFDKAIQYWHQALELSEELKSTRNICTICTNLSVGYSTIKQTDTALEYANRCLQLYQEYGPQQDLASTYNNLGSIYEDAQDYENALIHYNKALEMMFRGEDQSHVFNCHLNIASILYHFQRHEEAIAHIDEAVKFKNYEDLANLRMRCFEHYTKNFKALGRYNEALEYAEKLNEEHQKRLEDMQEGMISKPEAEYYRHRIVAQTNQYKAKNQELQKRNRIIKQKTSALKIANLNLHQKNEILSRLISVLSHDVRSPIINVVQVLELINQGTLSPEESKTMLLELESNGRRVLTFIGNLLSWISVERSGAREEQSASEVDIIMLLNNVISLYKPIADYKHITLETTIDLPSLKARINADIFKLVIRNILSNAIKFTPPGGDVTISASDEINHIHISICDSGAGMNEEQIKNLFSGKLPSSKGSNLEEGMGIGFKLCRDYITQLRGTITVDSTPGKGSCFSVFLPLS